MNNNLTDLELQRIVRWDEPHPTGGVCECSCTAGQAIEHVRRQAEQRGYTYDSDQRALDEFMIVNWAWLERVGK